MADVIRRLRCARSTNTSAMPSWRSSATPFPGDRDADNEAIAARRAAMIGALNLFNERRTEVSKGRLIRIGIGVVHRTGCRRRHRVAGPDELHSDWGRLCSILVHGSKR